MTHDLEKPPAELIEALMHEAQVERLQITPGGIYRLAYVAHNYKVPTFDALPNAPLRRRAPTTPAR